MRKQEERPPLLSSRTPHGRETLERTASRLDYFRDTCRKSILPRSSDFTGRPADPPHPRKMPRKQGARTSQITQAVEEEYLNCPYLIMFLIAFAPDPVVGGPWPPETSPRWPRRAAPARILPGWRRRSAPPAARASAGSCPAAARKTPPEPQDRRPRASQSRRRQRTGRMRLRERSAGGKDLRREGPRLRSPHSGVSCSRSRTTSVPAARSPSRWCWRVTNIVITPTA